MTTDTDNSLTITPDAGVISGGTGVITAGVDTSSSGAIRLTSHENANVAQTRRTNTNVAIFDPSAKYTKAVEKGDKRVINFAATNFIRDALSEPESIRNITIAGTISNRELPALWEVRVAWTSSDNQARWCMLVGSNHAQMPAAANVITVGHRHPDDAVNYRRALVTLSVENIIGIGVRYRGTDSVYYYKVISVGDWPSEAVVPPENERLCAVNLELVAIRTKNITTGECLIWPEEAFDTSTERGMSRMFGQVIDNFQDPEHTPCYIEYFRRGKLADTSQAYFIGENVDYCTYAVSQPEDMLLYLRKELAKFRRAFSENGRIYTKYIHCNARYSHVEGDVWSLTISVPSLDESVFESFAVKTDFDVKETPFSVIDEPAVALGSTREACASRLRDAGDDITVILKTRL